MFAKAIVEMAPGATITPGMDYKRYGVSQASAYRVCANLAKNGAITRVSRSTYKRVGKPETVKGTGDVSALLDTIVNAVSQLESIALVSLRNIPTADLLAELSRRHGSAD